VSALVAARHLMRPARLRKDADVDVFDVSASDGKRDNVLRLARRRAGMAADTTCVVNYLGPLNPVRLFRHKLLFGKRDYNISPRSLTLTNLKPRNKLGRFGGPFMRLKFAFSFLILGTALILISCNGVEDIAKNNAPKPAPTTPTATETITADGVRRVTPNELEAMMKNGEVFVADVRNQTMWDAGHIPGAKLIPVGEVANRVNEFPRNKLIVTYCS
jgi:hypothetical protein